MKRTNPTNEKIVEAQSILTYMERKVAHQKRRLTQMQQKQAFLDMTAAVELSSLCGRVIFHRDGALRKRLDEEMREHALSVVMRSPATLQFKFKRDGGALSIDVVALSDNTTGGLPLRYDKFATQYLEQELLARGDRADCDDETTLTDRVLIYHTMPTIVADKFWRGPYGVLVSREFNGCVAEDGFNMMKCRTSTDGSTLICRTEVAEDVDEDGEPVGGPPPSEKEWKQRFAWRSPCSRLWYCARTARLLGKPTTGDF